MKAHEERVKRAQSVVDSSKPQIQKLHRQRFQPSYERRREIDKTNNQLVSNMAKISRRKNRFLKTEQQQIFNTVDRGKEQN